MIMEDPEGYCNNYNYHVEKQAAYEKAQAAGAFDLLRFHMRYDGLLDTLKIIVRRVLKR